MNKNKGTQKCEYYDNCPVRYKPFSIDKSTFASHYLFRVVFAVMSWFLLSYKVSEGFFTAALFFVLPMLADAVSHIPIGGVRRAVRWLNVLLLTMWCAAFGLGVVGIFEIDVSQMTVQTSPLFVGFHLDGLPISHVWSAMLSVVIITILDWALCEFVINTTEGR